MKAPREWIPFQPVNATMGAFIWVQLEYYSQMLTAWVQLTNKTVFQIEVSDSQKLEMFLTQKLEFQVSTVTVTSFTKLSYI